MEHGLLVRLRRNSLRVSATATIAWLVFGSSLALFSGPAFAGVIYRWHNVIIDDEIGPLGGVIEIDRQYWSLGGSLSHTGAGCDIGPDGSNYYCPYFGVIRFSLSNGAPGFSDELELSEYAANAPIGPGNPPPYRSFGAGDWNFQWTFGELLSGSIYAHDLSSTTAWLSGDPLWTVTQIGSDSPGNCYYQCDNGIARGFWLLDPASVPEPGTLALLALGLLGLGFTARRRLH